MTVTKADGKQVHATGVDIGGAGVLLRGPPGSGKSDLALRLIDRGAKLVADDRTDLSLVSGRVVMTAPAAIAGIAEIRGIGITAFDQAPESPLVLVADLVAASEIERLPEARHCEYLGRQFPLIALAPFEASAAAKTRLAVRLALGDNLVPGHE